MTDTIEQQISEIKKLTLAAAQFTFDDEITSCQQALKQRQTMLVALDKTIQASLPEHSKSPSVESYIDLMSWILRTDEAAINKLNEQKSTILQKSVKQSKTKYALKQYQSNSR